MGADENKQLFDLVRELTAKVAALTAIIERAEKAEEEGDKRIRDLELENAKRKGIMTVVAAIGGIVGSIAVWIVKHLWGGN